MTYEQVKSTYKQMKMQKLRKRISHFIKYILRNRKVLYVKVICLIHLFFIGPHLTRNWAGDCDMLSVVSTVNLIAACLFLFYRKENRYGNRNK